jgi:hypothetical protein
MTQSRKDRDLRDGVPGQSESTPEESLVDDADNDGRSGRVGYDERGNPIWEWKLETGVYSRDVTTSKLKKLELSDLSIADTASHQRPPGLAEPATPKQPAPMPGGGFNPYNSAPPATMGSNPYDKARAASREPEPQQSEEPAPRRQVDLKKLEEWMEIRRRVQEQQQRAEQDDDDDDE